jgi:hypothetical protein
MIYNHKKSPLNSWNPFNIFMMNWVSPLVKKASKREIKVEDMPHINQKYEYDFYTKKIRHKIEEMKKNQYKPS